MHKERLLRLADLLDIVPADQFNLSHWKCGTTACAVGWACTIPEFQAEGLHLTDNDPVFGDFASWPAVRMFFELDKQDANHLFFVWDYPNRNRTTPAEVATRIRELVLDSSK
jgi:hypothetical protein